MAARIIRTDRGDERYILQFLSPSKPMGISELLSGTPLLYLTPQLLPKLPRY